jgi:hypothetical protein
VSFFTFQQIFPFSPHQDREISYPTCLGVGKSFGYVPAIHRPALLWSPFVDAATTVNQVDAITVRFVRQHEVAMRVRVWFNLVAGYIVTWQQPNGITMTTPRTTIAGDFKCHGHIFTNPFQSKIACVLMMALIMTMLNHVFSSCHNFQIFNCVIFFIPVFVVDNFILN